MWSSVRQWMVVSAMVLGLSSAASLAGSSAASAQEAGSVSTRYGKPDKAQLDVFYGSVEDPPAKKLLGVNEEYEGRSYLAGDEWHMELYYPYIDKLGGGYIGVGSDQGYMLMSWMEAEYGWLIDYDPLVIVTHKIYRAFFLEATSPKDFLALWEKSGEKRAQEILKKYWEKDEHYKLIQSIYTKNRSLIQSRHKRVKQSLDEAKLKSYHNDQGRYDHIRGMILEGRVRPMQANLLDTKGIRGIGAAAKQMQVPIRILYVSNAQQYWDYTQEFRDNIAALPFDEKSYVLHTLSTWSINKDYRYVLQGAQNFAAWMQAAWLKKVNNMIPRRKLKGEDDIDFIHFKQTVEEAEAKRAKKK